MDANFLAALWWLEQRALQRIWAQRRVEAPPAERLRLGDDDEKCVVGALPYRPEGK